MNRLLSSDRQQVEMEVITDAAEKARAGERRVDFDRNWAWWEANASEISERNRDKCICIAGQELFVAETAKDALAMAQAAHPEDKGLFVHYIPKEKTLRIYAY